MTGSSVIVLLLVVVVGWIVLHYSVRNNSHQDYVMLNACLFEEAFENESKIAVCISTKDIIMSVLERSSFWRSSKLPWIAPHLQGWYSKFFIKGTCGYMRLKLFKSPLNKIARDSILLFRSDNSHIKSLFIADNFSSNFKFFVVFGH